MGADDLLDQDRWLGETRGMAEAARASVRTSALTVDQQIRSTALQAAATWLAGESPYLQGRGFVLDTAAVFAGWIEGGSQRCSSPGSTPESSSEANREPSGTQGLDRTNQSAWRPRS